MNIKNLLFSFSGRIDRETYFLGWLFASLLIIIGYSVIYISYEAASGLLGIFLFGLGFLMKIPLAAKRFHDRDKSAWWVLAWLFIGIIGLELLFGKGTDGPNRFGLAPLSIKSKTDGNRDESSNL